MVIILFFFNDTATTEIYTLSLHDALPIFIVHLGTPLMEQTVADRWFSWPNILFLSPVRSEEHTSELQSRLHLVCRLLLEKKKKGITRSRPRISQTLDPSI